jgi:alkylhydroperoxidase family enzyme
MKNFIYSLISRRLDAAEEFLGESLEYLRHIARTSLSAFFKFALFTPLSQHRKKLPVEAYHVARLVATQDEDCGTCVQIIVNVARREKVPVEILKAVLDARPDDLPPDLRDVYHFAAEVVKATYMEEEYRGRLRERYGEEGLIELALAIASARVFPVTKRALGYALSCSKVEVRV